MVRLGLAEEIDRLAESVRDMQRRMARREQSIAEILRLLEDLKRRQASKR